NMPYGVCDINNDCVLEIFIVATHTFEVASNFKDRIICYSLEGDIIWISNVRVDNQNFSNTTNFGAISFADFNQDGNPELYLLNEIYNARTGVLLAKGGSFGVGIREYNGIRPSFGKTVACNLDDDPQLELAAGYT